MSLDRAEQLAAAWVPHLHGSVTTANQGLACGVKSGTLTLHRIVRVCFARVVMSRSERCQFATRRKTHDDDVRRIDTPFLGPAAYQPNRTLRICERLYFDLIMRTLLFREPILQNEG